MTTYPFRQGIDYGPRQGTLGLGFHMSEGGDELVSYLAKRSSETVAQWHTRVRGVSANACILSDGTVWNMVAWGHAAGSFNPADRGPATGYYNAGVIEAVLGPHYVDPNTWSIVAEIAGRRADGPTPAQVKAAIAWGLDMRAKEPTLRGAFGHHDQTDTKGCPGTTAAMKAIFAGVGGHGLWTPQEDNVKTFPLYSKPTVAVVKTGAWLYDNDGLSASPGNVQVSPAKSLPAVGRPGTNRIVDLNGNAMWVRLADCISISETPPVVVPAPDCTAAVKLAVDPLNARLARIKGKTAVFAADVAND